MVEITPYEAHPSSFYHSRVDNLFYSERWLAVLRQTYNYQYQTVLHTPSGQFVIVTVLDHLAGKKVVSLPFCDYTPINETYQESLRPIVVALQERYPHYRIILKTGLPATRADGPTEDSVEPTANIQPLGWLPPPTRRAFYHRIDTTDSEQISLSSSFRRGVKKAQKSGVSVEVCTHEAALRTFYQLYYQLRFDKFGSIPQPYAFFQHVYQEFIASGQGFILEAHRQQRVIASIIVLQHHTTLYYKFGCSDQASLTYRPNNLLFQRLTELATERGCTAVDLGLSGTGASYEGLVRFKESMGGVRHPISYFTFTPESYDERTERECKTLLSTLTNTMVEQRLDLEATSQLSATLYPYFA